MRGTVAKTSSKQIHNHVLKKSDVALLLIDVINDFNFVGSERLLKFAAPAAQKILTLKKACAEQGIPAIYVNDNFGTWRSDFKTVVKYCSNEDSLGAEICKLLSPDEEDYFVLKPMHSGFYSTSLQAMLSFLGCKKLILTGFAGNICVLFSANDAYMRGYSIFVPQDCIASNTKLENDFALKQMESILKADTSPTSKLIKSLANVTHKQHRAKNSPGSSAAKSRG